jgi:SAM-dependent methyltransferase
MSDHAEFYSAFYSRDPRWSTRYPNEDQGARLGKILECLSFVADTEVRNGPLEELRILDLGCGRGWLTYFADVFGRCEGIDPVEAAVVLARESFPSLTFHQGTASDLIREHPDVRYDVIISTEVIEHVPPEQKDGFVADITRLLRHGGYAIITTPRGELWDRCGRAGTGSDQPVEAWLTEGQLGALFRSHGFVPIRRDRTGWTVSHPVVRWSTDPRVVRLASRIRIRWALEVAQYVARIYQVWLFKLEAGTAPKELAGDT